jgi:DNA polymerase III delta prime subunit
MPGIKRRKVYKVFSNYGRCTFDIIEGKGRGLVALFHGPPGVGKTLTVATTTLATASSQSMRCHVISGAFALRARRSSTPFAIILT